MRNLTLAHVFAVTLVLAGWGQWAMAEEMARFSLERSQNGAWLLDAKQADLPKLLGVLAERTRSTLHFSQIPLSRVSATCVGANAVALLRCLLGDGVSMAVRDARGSVSAGAGADGGNEIWIMGSSLVDTNSDRSSAGCDIARADFNSGQSDQAQSVARWLKQAQDRNPALRLAAITELAHLNATADEPSVTAALRKALTDRDARVRMQAIGGVVARDGEAAVSGPLSQALQDDKAEIRLMALDYIETDVNLLQSAAQDSDPAVRGLAQVKLELLAKPEE
ncbi:HEAT repeat domain-containing protein [Methylomonas sp. SURF-1]|uniref:HEAT repeat domain-containing protein n=1 Tax=Methylomonas aurea TaxID=2952224 RepID=A0ABT1UMH1_9GAMM|nr:HEAT repeat domain-containing protein [Methylomonas sp. SURF-1]MCQ8183436.1 HEAT repeat domain-containing protein [Methylomonas sp. SURF-1]